MLERSNYRHNPRTHRIVFEMLDGSGLWSLDPQRGLLPQDTQAAALRIRTTADVLQKLIYRPEYQLKDEDAFYFEGDLDLLDPLIEALNEGLSMLALRARS